MNTNSKLAPIPMSLEEFMERRYANNSTVGKFIAKCFFSSRKQRRLLLKGQNKQIGDLVRAELTILRKYKESL